MDNTSKYCPNCCQLYFLKALSPEGYGNLPIVLSCGHTMCHNCVCSILKFEEPLDCKICQQEIPISQEERAIMLKNKSEFDKFFPVNVFMLGELTMQHLKSIKGNKNLETPCFIDLDAIIKNTKTAEGECTECRSPSNKVCQQCDTILCVSCFNKSHKNFIIFKNHVLQNLGVKFDESNCKLHQNRPLEYYCKTCKKPICVDCLLLPDEKSCKNHDFVSIQQENETFLAEIKEASPKVDELYRRLTKTAVDVGNLLQSIQSESDHSDLTQLLNQVEQHYSKLISLIQAEKDEVTSKIIEIKTLKKESLLELKHNIENGIKKTIQFSNIVKNFDHTELQKVNWAAVLEDARNILNQPWYLEKDDLEDSIQVTVNEKIFDEVKGYVHLEGTSAATYKLYTTSELQKQGIEVPSAPCAAVHPPKDNVRQVEKKKEPTKLILYRNAPTYRSKSGSFSSVNSSNSEATTESGFEQFMKPIVQPVSPFPESQHPKLKEGSQEVIYISHIIDPHNFFVQRACLQPRVQELLQEFRNPISLPRPSPNHIAEGKIYLMHNNADDLWLRCRIVSIERKNPLTKYRVFTFDFGATEIVTIDKLRVLPPARVHSPPPFAINCCLANCQPKNGTWTRDDAFLIQNIVDNKQAVINVRHVRSMAAESVTLEVDVTTLDHGVSLAHALVFHSRAYLPDRLPYAKLPQLKEKLKIFDNNYHFQRDGEVEVCITHTESPDRFFVRLSHLQTVYQDVCDELEQEFSTNKQSGIIYLPEKDMVCAVNVEKYGVRNGGRWERARICGLPGHGRVRVFLLDSGLTLLVHWDALRRLTARHTTRQALATECNLAGITPANRKWSPESVKLLKEFEDRLLKLRVEEARSHGSLGVKLFSTSSDDDEETVCINELMVHHKYAIAFGLTMFKDKIDDKYRDHKNISNLPEKKVTEQSNSKSESSFEAINKGPLRLEVKILNFTSPSHIYVSLVQQQTALNELFDNIQKYYTKKTNLKPKQNWNIGDRCCNLSNSSKTWRRAAILEIIDNNVKVFYCDFACVEIVPLNGLRELPEKFASIGDGAILCHLFGIMPAGQEWPSVTKEYLGELLEAYSRIFITKTGKFKGKSMPVELWVYHTTPGGALDPDISEWRCLNNKIVDQGLAIPDKSEMATLECSEQGGDLTFLNLTGSIRDWLQLEPVPTKSSKVDPPQTTQEMTDIQEADAALASSDTVFEVISDWLPPEPFKKKEIRVVPTYIDNNGIIYLHDIEQQDSLNLIQKALYTRFKDPDPKAKFAKWSIGEPCIAQYFLDNQFYRGRVLEVDNEASSCLIHYVDYGNEEICAFENLRKSIALYQFPIQASKCVLSRIKPNGKQWDTKALDYIHKSIVDKECFVKICGDPIGGIIPIELKFDKLWINDHLVDFELAQYTDGSKPIVRVYASKVNQYLETESVEDLDSGPDYIVNSSDGLDKSVESVSTNEDKSFGAADWNKMIEEDFYEFKEFPKNTVSEFLCKVTELNGINKLELSIIFDEDKNEQYENMYGNLQQDWLNMSALNGILGNKACVAIFPDDGKWYRAIILQCNQIKGLVKVHYVDYGNEEIISLADVREISDEYLTLPPATISAKLHNVHINPNIDPEQVIEEMVAIFADSGPFHAKIIDSDAEIPSVEIRDDDHNLVYDVLFKKEIFFHTD
ncbi:unnamed protein product [Pieris macdunnoughi]|uniref:RING finger protein 17 n=1 Tax=Pieris macdunnoughi TaxID=345717 RepID=A0A821QJB9_9NEOP|nr:unnamed protein product [Pieris macdunnoughi]